MGRDAQVPFIASPTDPQCEQCRTMYGHNATIVNSHCRLPLCRDRQANGQWQPYRSTQISSSAAYPALFGLLRTWIEKIETNEMRNGRGWGGLNLTVQGHSPLMVMVMVASVMMQLVLGDGMGQE